MDARRVQEGGGFGPPSLRRCHYSGCRRRYDPAVKSLADEVHCSGLCRWRDSPEAKAAEKAKASRAKATRAARVANLSKARKAKAS